MASEERLGASFSIDITALKTGLTQANRLIRESNSEFKAAAAGLDDWTESEEGLTAKLKNLNTVADLQGKKVEALQKEYDRCIAEGLDPMSAAAVKMRTDLNNEQAALNKTKSEVEKYTKKLEESGKEADNTGKDLKELKKDAEDSGEGFTIAKGAIADFIGNGLSALAGACKNAISSIANLAGETQEYREDMGKLKTAFESAGKSTELATDTYKKFYSVLGEEDRSVEAVNHLAKLVETEEDMQKWTDICAGVWGTFGDSLPIEGLTEAANETAKVGKLTGVLADALNWAGVNEDDFQTSLDACNSESERSALITETLNGLYKEAAENYKENNKSVIEARNAQSDYTDTVAEFGSKIEPITAKVKEGFNKIFQKVLELTEGVDFDAFGNKIDKAFDVFINDVIPKIIEAFDWIKANGKTIVDVLSAILAGFVAFKVVTGIISAVAAAQAVWNAVMAASPITWIVLGIAALVAGIVLLIKNWDAVKEAGKNALEGIKKAFAATVDWIKKAFASVVNWFKDNWQAILLFLINPFAGIAKYLYDHCEWFKNLFDGVANWFKELWSKISTWIDDNVLQPIISFVKPFIDFIVDLVRVCWEIIAALWGVVASWFNDNVIVPVSNFFKSLWESVSGFFVQLWSDIKSVWITVSTWFNDNVVTPMANFFADLWESLKEKAADAWQKIKDVFAPVGEFFGGIWDKIKEKFTTIGTQVAEAIGGAFKAAINSVITVVEGSLNTVPRAINGALTAINKLPGVDIAPMSEISLPRLAKGGVVNRATNAIIGEDGAEAIVPLERNTEWIDKLAEKLESKAKTVVVNQTNNYSQAHSRYEIYKSKKQTADAVRLALLGV